MKRNYTLSRGSFLLFILISLIAVVSCNTSGSANPDGWYLTDDGIETKGSPIATIQDFAYLKIDTLNMNGTIYYELQSQMKPEAMQKFAEYTEKNIGKVLGFVHNEKIIFRPIIHKRIDDGKVAIASSILSKDKKEIIEIFENISMKMNQ
ncbi:MAG: hypothetical protein LUH22_01310 [Bacteroides sp.]|nr:hypothetical protein [Bacteroides sp.]